MTEGTRSLLIGCHQFIMHPIQVIRGWKWWFGYWPKPWQVICIFLHDVGLFGRQYLSDHEAKNGHWKFGAKIAKRLFGPKGYLFCAGHTPESGHTKSDLWYADKASWLVAPMWWLWLNYRNEKFTVSHPHLWQIIIARNILEQNHFSGHQLYLDEVKNVH